MVIDNKVSSTKGSTIPEATEIHSLPIPTSLFFPIQIDGISRDFSPSRSKFISFVPESFNLNRA